MKFALIILFCFSLFASACPLDEHHKLERNIDAKIKRFHLSFNDAAYSDIYDSANDELKNQQTESTFAENMKLIKIKTGLIKMNAPVELPIDFERYVRFSVGQNIERVQYKNMMTCENGIGLEKFTFHITDEKIELVSYDLENVGRKFKLTGKDGKEYIFGKDE